MSNTGTYELVRLAGGVCSIRSVDEDEVFHPVVGPVAEAEALYVRQVRLADRLAAGTDPFVVWDVGLGAAANALTVIRAARDFSRPLRIFSFDRTLAPLRFALENAESLGYLEGYQSVLASLLEQGSRRFQSGSIEVSWSIALGDFPTWLATAETVLTVEPPHLILYDAFSPAKNPGMWTLPVFRSLFARLSAQRPCLMPTYSRSTLLRVTLLLAGFYVGAGHATGEKEETTIAANSLAELADPLRPEWLGRVRRSRSAEPMIEAHYSQGALSEENWQLLRQHPQFR